MNIMKTVLILLTASLAMFISCENIPSERSGFELPFDAGSAGECMTTVEFSVTSVRLTGYISISAGSITAEVMSPSGAAVFTVTVDSPGEMLIDRSFQVEEGEWWLRYRSLNGKGHLRMHLNLIR